MKMDIKKLKEQADKAVIEGDSVKELRIDAIKKYREFRSVCDELSPLITSAVITKKEQLVKEFVNYFEENGFEVTKELNGNFIASYKDVIVNFKDDNPDENDNEAFFGLDIKSQEVYTAIVIKAEERSSDKLYLKRVLKYKDNYLEFKDAEDTIQGITEIGELQTLIFNIEENIQWYKDTVKNFKDINFIYSLYKTDKEYPSFKRLFESL
jgi:hypothetical protein